MQYRNLSATSWPEHSCAYLKNFARLAWVGKINVLAGAQMRCGEAGSQAGIRPS